VILGEFGREGDFLYPSRLAFKPEEGNMGIWLAWWFGAWLIGEFSEGRMDSTRVYDERKERTCDCWGR